MGGVRIFTVVAQLLSVLALWLVPEGAQARENDEPKFAAQCHATSAETVTLERMAQSSAWICEDRDWTASEPVAWLRFDAANWAGEALPRYFYTRIARHEAITFGALDANGTIRTASYVEADGKPFAAGPVFQLTLPEVTEQTQAVIVKIDKPPSPTRIPPCSVAELPQVEAVDFHATNLVGRSV